MTKDTHDGIRLESAEHLLTLLLALENARIPQDGQMTGDDGHVDAASSRDAAHGAWPSAFRNPHQELESFGIGQCLEKLRR